MIKEDNPAGRLYSILLEVKQKAHSLQLKTVWTEIFGVGLLEIYLNLARLQEMVNEIEKDIRQQDVDADIYLQRLPNVRQFLAQTNLDQGLHASIQMLDEGVLMSLQFCSERLSKTCPEHLVTADQINELLEEIANLSQNIANSNLNKTLKSVLLDLVESMRRALAEYKIRGGAGLRQELFHIFERLQRNIPELQANKDEPSMSLFWDILTKYDLLTSICVNAPVVLQGFQKVLALAN